MALKALVVSNCQATTTAETLRFALANSEVRSMALPSLADKATAHAAVEQFRWADVVFSLELDEKWIHPEVRQDILGAVKKFQRIESVDFTGFHPDMGHIQLKSGAYLGSPIGMAHSAICIAGVLAGLDDDTIERKFNALIYRKLGYFEVFDQAKAELIEKFARIGLDISEQFELWMRRGCFMYTVSHPHSYVVASVTALACQAAGFVVPDADFSQFFPDLLTLDAVYPVYPQIARALNVPGSYCWKAPSSEGQKLFSLREFVRGSTDIMRRSDQEDWIVSPRIQQIAAFMKSAG